MTITFATSTRPDKVVSFKGGFEEDTNYRISQITAAVNASTVRQYNLSYTTGNNGNRSLLSSIQENGYDDNNVQTSLPAMTFSYVSSSTSFATTTGSGIVNGDPYLAADVNGDGQNDSTNIECVSGSGPENGYIYPDGATSTTFTPPQVNNLCWSSGTTGNGALNETGTRFVDVNADGKADIVQSSYSTTTRTLLINSISIPMPLRPDGPLLPHGPELSRLLFYCPPTYTTGFFGDVNGDGLPDYVIALASSTGQIVVEWCVFRQWVSMEFCNNDAIHSRKKCADRLIGLYRLAVIRCQWRWSRRLGIHRWYEYLYSSKYRNGMEFHSRPALDLIYKHRLYIGRQLLRPRNAFCRYKRRWTSGFCPLVQSFGFSRTSRGGLSR